MGFAYCLGRSKAVSGYEWWTWIAAFAAFYVLSAVLLAKATQTLPIGTAYPVWTGIGAIGAVLVGIFVFREPATRWNFRVPRTSHILASILSNDAHCVYCRTKNYFMMEFREMRRKRQQLAEEESIAILEKATAGTLALLGDNDYPYAVPISYVYHEGKLYFHSALAGHKVDAIRKCDKASYSAGEVHHLLP